MTTRPSSGSALGRYNPNTRFTSPQPAQQRSSIVPNPSSPTGYSNAGGPVSVAPSLIRRGGGGGSPTVEPTQQQTSSAMPVEVSKIIRPNNPVLTKINTEGKPGLIINERSQKLLGEQGYGMLSVSPGENIGNTMIPYWIVQSKTPTEAIAEGSLTSQIPVYGAVTSSGQRQSNLAVISQAHSYFSNEIAPFLRNPEATGIGTSTSEGVTYTMPEGSSEKYFGKEAMTKAYGNFAPGTTLYNQRITWQEAGQLASGQTFTTFGKATLGIVDILGTVGKTAIYNFGVKQVGTGGIKTYETPDLLGIKSTPSAQYGTSTFTIPILGLQIPTSNPSQFARETLQNPGNMLAIGNVYLLGRLGFQGYKGTSQFYSAARAEGYSVSSSISMTAARAIGSLNPIKTSSMSIERGIYYPKSSTGSPLKYSEVDLGGVKFKGGIKGGDVRQLNYGTEMTSTKIGTIGEASAYEAKGLPEQALYRSTGELSYTSINKGIFRDYVGYGSTPFNSLQSVSLSGNIFGAKPTQIKNVYQIGFKGERSIYTVGQYPSIVNSFKMESLNFAQRTTQSFSGFGKARMFETPLGKRFSISIGEAKFRNIRMDTFIGGKNPYITSKTSFVGRPSIGRGTEFNFEVARIGLPKGEITYGRSFSELRTTKTKVPTYFKSITKVPSSDFIKIEGTGGQGPQNLGYPKGIKVERIYTKGEFDYMKPQESIQLNKQVSKSIGKSIAKGYSRPSNIIKLQTDNTQINGLKLNQDVRQIGKIGLGTFSTLGLSQNVGANNIFRPSTKQITALTPASALAITPIQGIDTQLTTQSITTFTPRVTIPSTIGFDFSMNIPTIIPPIITPFPSIGFQEFTPGPRRQGKQKKRRLPTLAAAALGITAPKASAFEITGLGTRPILTARRKK